MHAGLKYPDDAPAPGLEEAARVARELAQMPDVRAAQAPVALVFDYASDWAWKTLPQGADFDYFRLVFETYRALRRQGLSVDILPSTTEDLSGYAMVFTPGLATLPAPLMAAMQRAGAVCLIGPRSNLVSENLALLVPPGPRIEGVDLSVRAVESLPPGTKRAVDGGGAVLHWFEHMQGDTEILLHTHDGNPVLVGKDGLYYLGGWPDRPLWDRLITDLAELAGLALSPLPDGLRLRDTATHRFAFNYAPEPVQWQGRTLAPADVVWWPHDAE